MAFTVEDGTKPAGANAYMTVQEFKDFHTDRGVPEVTGGDFGDAEIQTGIINATDYIDKRFGRRFRGWRSTRNQFLEWPRTDAYDDDDYTFQTIPNQLKNGTAEYALLVLQLGRNLAPPPGNEFGTIDPSDGSSGTSPSGQLSGSEDTVGPITEKREYRSSSEAAKPWTSTGNMSQRIPEYPQADLWIEEIIRSSTSRGVVRG